MLHIFWTCQLSPLINMKLPHTKLTPATALCSRPPPHFNVSGAFLTCCVAARRWANTHVQPYSATHEPPGCGSGAAALSSSISLQDPFTVCKSDITLSHLSYLFLSSRFIRAQHTRLEIPSTPLFLSRNQNLFGCERDCRFFHVTQSINLLFIIALFSTDERWGWRMGGNVFTVTMTRRVLGSCSSSSFPLSVSLLLPCNKSAVLCLLTQFCAVAIDPPLGAEFTTILGHAQKLWMSSSLVFFPH